MSRTEWCKYDTIGLIVELGDSANITITDSFTQYYRDSETITIVLPTSQGYIYECINSQIFKQEQEKRKIYS